MKRVGQGVFEFPDPLRLPTTAVPFYVYEITRREWEVRRAARPAA
jgi:hypothetical protein